jgi:hypothetical protein
MTLTRTKITRGILHSLIFCMSLMLVAADNTLIAQDQTGAGTTAGQDANAGQTTGQAEAGQQSSTPRRRRGAARRRRRPAAPPAADAAQTGMDQTGATAGAAQPDLSGTYSGNLDFPEAGLSGESTITISGNQVTINSGGTTRTGRISTVNSRGYTAAALQLDQPAGSPTTNTAPLIISLRALKRGDNLTLSSIKGESRQFSFNPAGTTASQGNRRRRGRTRGGITADVTGTGTTTPATTPDATAAPDAGTGTTDPSAAAPATETNRTNRRRGRGNRRRGNTQATEPATPATPATPETPAMPEAPSAPESQTPPSNP